MTATSSPRAAAPDASRPAAGWHVHIGAHKTATTHLQSLLGAMRDDLAAQDTRVLLRAELRKPMQRARNTKRGISRIREELRLRHDVPRDLRRLAGTARRVVASEEDILGRPSDLMQPVFYPDLRALHLLRRTAGSAPLTLYVSLRSYDRLLPSVLFEMLKGDPQAQAVWQAGVDRFCQQTGAVRAGWPDLLDRIAAGVPDATLCFWCQERYAEDAAPALRALTGQDNMQVPDLAVPARTRAPSAAALPEVAALDPKLPKAERADRVREIYARHFDANAAPLIPAETAEALHGRYEDDLRSLRSRYTEIGA